MTRVNADLDPKLLRRRHLVAELREITMVPASLRRSLRTRSKESILRGIPERFTLGKGHVTFFYDKQGFLLQRFRRLATEMERRGYTPDRSRARAFKGLEPCWNKDWSSSPRDDRIVKDRIEERIQQKPHLYVD